MKKICLGIAALAALIAAPAFAADLPMKAPPPPPPVWTCTGWYIGANGGYGWNERTGDQGCVTPVAAGAVPSGTGCWLPMTGLTKPEGGLWGAQVGYNWQVGQIVWGIEGDLQWSHIDKTGTTTNLCCIPTFTSAVGLVTTQSGLEWFGTARGRVGYLVTPSALLYVTGGLIYGSENTMGTEIFPAVTYITQANTIRAGGIVGAGLEYKFTENLSGKLEGLWYDMGSTNNTFTSTVTNFTMTEHFKFDGGIVRGGLNWKFSGQ